MRTIPKYHNITSNRKDVTQFLALLKGVLEDPSFVIEEDLFFIKKRENNETLLDLDYELSDVVEKLLELNIQNYSETLIDDTDENPPLLFVFGIDISGKEVYIKIKVRTQPKKTIVCVSFHWAQHTMLYPYK